MFVFDWLSAALIWFTLRLYWDGCVADKQTYTCDMRKLRGFNSVPFMSATPGVRKLWPWDGLDDLPIDTHDYPGHCAAYCDNTLPILGVCQVTIPFVMAPPFRPAVSATVNDTGEHGPHIRKQPCPDFVVLKCNDAYLTVLFKIEEKNSKWNFRCENCGGIWFKFSGYL